MFFRLLRPEMSLEIIIMRPESSSLVEPDLEVQERRQCVRIIDNSEPCIWVMGLLGIVGVVVGLIPPSAFLLTVAVSLILLAILSSWRVRVLGSAYALMESVDTLREENDRLADEVKNLNESVTVLKEASAFFREEVVVFKRQNDDLKGVIGLVGDGVRDIDAATDRILALYEKYKEENVRQEKNNLMALFDVIDRDNDGILDEKEMSKLKQYVARAYNRDITDFDGNADGNVSFEEFVKNVA